MNIKILQAENSIENVDRSVISALYNAHINGDISLEVDNNNQKVGLVGSITAPAGYAILVSTLNSAYPKFHVTVNSEYISFEDANVELILLNIGLGDGVGITVLAAGNSTFTSSTFLNNTTITSFNEFPYFTKANTNPPNLLFMGCNNLSSIDLSNVTKCSNEEFKNSGITGVLELPNLTLLGEECFKGTSITKLLDLGSVTSIPGKICHGVTTLTEVTIPSTCHTLSGYGHFSSCSNLIKVNGLSNLTNIGNLAFNGTSLINNNLSELVNVTTLNRQTFAGCNIQGELNLPNLLSASSTEFAQCKNITKVKCLNKLSSIPEGFLTMWEVKNDTLLTEVYLPKECTVIGSSGFYGCTQLTTIKQYTDSTDNWIEGQTPTYGDLIGITTLLRDAFRECRALLSINLPNVVTIGLWAFRDCIALSSINLPNVVTIGYLAFLNCTSLTSVTLPCLTTLGESAFYNCTSVTGSLNLPNLTSIGFLAFYNTRITKVENLGSIIELPGGVFLSCSNLTEVNIPTTVTILNDNVFNGCPNLRKITGFDNIISVAKNSYQIYNTTITNPVGFKNFTLFPNISGQAKSSIFFVNGQEGDMNIHSLFYPKLLSTVQCSETWYGLPKHSFFLSNSIGNKRLITGLLYFKDITSFGTGTFFAVNITNLVINNATPPTLDNSDTTYNTESWWADWGEYIFGNGNLKCTIGTLWVPDSAVATYQADPLYSGLTIKGINTKTNGVDYDLPRYADFVAWEVAEEAAVAQGEHAPVGLIEAWM